ncbi:L,D-transpeptidase family protein [Candidatus Binatia bacterium]|jgi:murein L,D-transpeptidase YcbB/YkuD|nr:L,D-transpeptidase family protein [Candidatus Binatia bacterium]
MGRGVMQRAGGGRAGRRRGWLCAILLAQGLLLGLAARPARADELSPLIAQSLSDPVPLSIDGTKLDVAALRALYDTRASAALWVTAPDANARIDAVVEFLRHVDADGLEPQAYRIALIEARRGATEPLRRAELDLLLSEAVMRYGVHVRTGARRPRVAIPEIEPMVVDPDPVPIALDLAAAPPVEIAGRMQRLAPPTADYAAMRELLAHYRQVAARGGWPKVGDVPKLTPGAIDPSVRRVRDRLLASGDLAADAVPPAAQRDLYDKHLEAAVKSFQKRHGLTPDGTIGNMTRDALNVTAAQRVDQIVANLERLRWLPSDLGERYVWINIPEFRLRIEDRGTTTLEMPVIVGKPTWQTPVFSSEIRHLVYNPPWNVPPRIAAEELIPRAMADGGYFAAQGISWRGGTRVASAGSGITDGGGVVTTPRRLRQAPGPKNPLGRVKFNMPNPFGVYLHDTPNKDKFRLTSRSLSHGCVRVGNAPALAAALLGDMPEWDEGKRKQALSDWSTRNVNLHSPVPVHIVYATAWRDHDGTVQFREDIYDSDAELARDLAKPRSIRPVAGSATQPGDAAPVARVAEAEP